MSFKKYLEEKINETDIGPLSMADKAIQNDAMKEPEEDELTDQLVNLIMDNSSIDSEKEDSLEKVYGLADKIAQMIKNAR